MEILWIIITIIVVWYIVGSVKVYRLRTMIDHIVHTLTWFGTQSTESLSYEKVKELLVQQNTLFQEDNAVIQFISPEYPNDWIFIYNHISNTLTAQNANIDSKYFDIKVQLYNGTMKAACFDTGAVELRNFMYWTGKKGIQEVRMEHLR